jgi:hypothetical protein
MPTRLTNEIIAAAILGFEEQKRHIDIQIVELRAALSGSNTAPTATPEGPKGKRRKMSAAARKRIGDAQRKRWAESKGQSESPSETFAAKAKRKMSAAGRKAISEATRKRWAAFHAAKGKEKPAIAANKGAVKKAPMKRVAMKAPAVRKAAKTAQAATQTAAQ